MNTKEVKEYILKLAKRTKGADLKTVKKILNSEKVDLLAFSKLLMEREFSK